MLTCFSKNFGQTAENVSLKLQLFWTKCKNFTVNVQKGKKNLSVKIYQKKYSGQAKSHWEIIVAKVFVKKFFWFIWKSEKNTKRLIVFQFFAFSKLILWTQRMHLPQFYPRLLEVGLVLHAWFFFNKNEKMSLKIRKT